jgi:hypothetical protein
MRFNGEWLQCADGVVRPVIRAKILAGDGTWRTLELLIDTGADRTLLSANVLRFLHLRLASPEDRIGGVGGFAQSALVTTQIQLTRDDGQRVQFRGTYAACTDDEALDVSILGRDILDMFAVVVDRPAEVIAILGGNHFYAVHQR